MLKITFFLISVSFVAGLSNAGQMVQNNRVQATLDEQRGRLTLADRATQRVFAAAENVLGNGAVINAKPVNDTVLKASGESLEVTYPDGRRLQVLVFENHPFVFFRTTLKHTGASPIVTNRVAYPSLSLDLGVAASSLNTLGTGGLRRPGKDAGSYMWTAVADPATRRGVVAGWITTERGSGIVRMDTVDDTARLLPHVDYGRLLLASGQSETLETFSIGLFDDARLGLEAYADTIAACHNIQLPPMPDVHCTWYVDGASRENVLTGRTAFAAQALKPFGLGAIQIDDGWQLGQTTNGPKKFFCDFNPKGPYPSGMKSMAETIQRAGFTPGIWLIPFAGSSDDPWFADKMEWFAKKPDDKPYDTRWGGTCLDLTRADTQDYLKRVIHTLTHDWGYRYLKMDGLYTGAAINLNYICEAFREDEIGQAVLANPQVTQIEMMRNSLKLVRETAGRDVFLLGCCTPQNMRSAGAAYGLVDAMRIGPDNGANWSAMMRGPESGAWNYFLHGRVWYNDPDPLYVRPSLPLSHAQVICSWVALSGQMNSSSEEYAKLPPERLDLLKRSMPSITSRTNIVSRPVDLFENRIPGIWHATDGQRDVIGLFNWNSAEKSFDEPLAKLGIRGDGEHIAFDYWSNALTTPFKDRLVQTLLPQSCAVLAMRRVLDRPQLISSSRHITQGLIDVSEVIWNPATRTLSGVSQVVANDRTELRILTHATIPVGVVESATITGDNGYELTIAPGEGLVARPDNAYANANTPDAPMTMLFEPKSEEGLVRVAFICGTSGLVSWRVTFSDDPAPALVPTADAVNADMPDVYGPVLLSWQSNTRACEIRRDGEAVAPAALGGAWRDTRVVAKTTYRYEIIPYTLTGVRGEPRIVTFTVPEIPQLGAVPPKPDVPLGTLKPVATAVGWGSFKTGTALNGPLRLGNDTYASGVCIHADGYAIYARDLAWKRFVAVVGVDESQRPADQSSIIFSVAIEAADGRRVLATSPVIRFGQRERWHFNIALPADAQRVVLLSESAGDGNKSDHGNWCDAGFIQ